MKSDLTAFYRINRNIFGVCRSNATLFRLSDTKIFLRTKPKKDWMDELDQESLRLDAADERLDNREYDLREAARVKGRALALRAVKKLDPVFGPRRLNPDDAKVLFHPVDYVVFKGMKMGRTKSILLLVRDGLNKDRLALQRSIDRVIQKGNYEWLTIRIDADGKITEHQ